MKSCLNSTAFSKAKYPDDRLFLVGHFSSDEPPKIDAQRTVNTEHYLAAEKGMPSSHIVVLYGGLFGKYREYVYGSPLCGVQTGE
jgi:hypothetical protein